MFWGRGHHWGETIGHHRLKPSSLPSLVHLKVPNLQDRILHSFYPNLTVKYNVVLFPWELLSNIVFEYTYCWHIVARRYLYIHTDNHNLNTFLGVVVGEQLHMLDNAPHLPCD